MSDRERAIGTRGFAEDRSVQGIAADSSVPPPALRPGRRLLRLIVVLSALLLLAAAAAVMLGTADVPPSAVLRVLAGRSDPDSIEHVVTLGLRLPRIAVAILAGGGLAVAGVAFQALTRNPLAEPSILGISNGAAFGVVVAQIFGLGLTVVQAVGLTVCAFAGAIVAAAAVYLIASGHRVIAVPTLLLAGVIVGIFFASAITVVISVVDVNRLGGVVHWLFGNIGPIPGGALAVFALLAATGFTLIAVRARELNVLALGEEAAFQLGVNTERLKLGIFCGAALLTATVVAFTGPIGFVGLIVPHLLRGLVGQDNRLLVPTALVGGGIFLLVADTIARTVIAPAELSVGVITSFFGAPFFVYLLRTRYRGTL